jgi:cellulose synthase/poly-beta-1,6-N-acetylglucosamine synthase-like glycosyltransferase
MKISILIPCHNEEVMVSKCIDSCLNQTRKPDQIIVINDGSTDNTQQILSSYKNKIQIINISNATGNKSKAQEIGLKYVTGDIVIATDGDTVLDTNFVQLIEDDFNNNPEYSVVAGYVESSHFNLITALREIDYTIGQDLHKIAQSYVNFLLVIPGCAGAFKTELFRDGSINFDHDTLTEDLDFTYKLNTLGLKIHFNRKAKVYTQDPPNLFSYINQMRRWYGGAWQNLKKHGKIVIKKPSAATILSVSYIEGLVFSILLFVLPFVNIILFGKVMFFFLLICISMGIYSGLRKKNVRLLYASPLIVIVTFINSYIFIEQFIKEILLKQKNMNWFHPDRELTN